MFTYDIARQSVVDKMVREFSLEVREKSGKSQGILFDIFGGNPDLTSGWSRSRKKPEGLW